MTTLGSAIAPALFLISKSAIQLPVHQQEPSAVDNSVCVPQGLGLSSACSWLVIEKAIIRQKRIRAAHTHGIVLKRTMFVMLVTLQHVQDEDTSD